MMMYDDGLRPTPTSHHIVYTAARAEVRGKVPSLLSSFLGFELVGGGEGDDGVADQACLLWARGTAKR